MSEFRIHDEKHGLVGDYRDDRLASTLAVWEYGRMTLSHGATHLGFVLWGPTLLETRSGTFTLDDGMYFSVPGLLRIKGGCGFVASRIGWQGFFQVGGPIEAKGRVCDIDGFSDSLLIPPVVIGDPCLNLQHFPSGMRFGARKHDALRLGMVAGGKGVCRLPDHAIPLETGDVFTIPAETEYCFATGKEELSVIIYQPNSHFGAGYRNDSSVSIAQSNASRFVNRIRNQLKAVGEDKH